MKTVTFALAKLGHQMICKTVQFPWDIHGTMCRPMKITNVLCPDRVRRTMWTTSTADTFFSIPGYVKVKGASVSGAAIVMGTADEADFHFIVTKEGKNAKLLTK